MLPYPSPGNDLEVVASSFGGGAGCEDERSGDPAGPFTTRAGTANAAH